ncbi:hypothetical protein OWV82_018010 [Melia azedarach]|uniref:Uncharacterized protein n=1 Tax=Melia azedarach TaxID=155640 RepID=A0ACC1X9H0_MELAZ|nr:hypothetical protein OWV82_018010 [Melia azedarach]
MVLGQPVVVSLFSNLLSAFASVWVDQCFLGNFMYHPAATAISAGNKLVYIGLESEARVYSCYDAVYAPLSLQESNEFRFHH